MNKTFISRISKLFFPHLARDQRQHRMGIILLVLFTSLFSVGVLSLWMMSTRGIHVVMSPSFPFLLK